MRNALVVGIIEIIGNELTTTIENHAKKDDIMGVYKAKEGKTKDGRIWFFKLGYQDMDGRNK